MTCCCPNKPSCALFLTALVVAALRTQGYKEKFAGGKSQKIGNRFALANPTNLREWRDVIFVPLLLGMLAFVGYATYYAISEPVPDRYECHAYYGKHYCFNNIPPNPPSPPPIPVPSPPPIPSPYPPPVVRRRRLTTSA